MADEKQTDAPVLQIVPMPRKRRWELPPLLRNGIIAAFGALSAVVAFYILRIMGS